MVVAMVVVPTAVLLLVTLLVQVTGLVQIFAKKPTNVTVVVMAVVMAVVLMPEVPTKQVVLVVMKLLVPVVAVPPCSRIRGGCSRTECALWSASMSRLSKCS